MRYTGGRDGYCQFSMSRALDAPALAILFPYRSSFAGNRIVSRWAVIDDDRPSSLLVTATSCWTQRANRFQFTLDSTASSTPCYCKAVAQQRAKFKPAHAAGPRPVMTSRRKQDRPRRVGVDRHRFRHKKGSINMAFDFFFRTVPSMHVCCPFCLSVSVSHVVW
ncbi:hypothetical protein T05_14256 [Trichinella murrelli]|uniref:Uncharacterized protein n=1 Tax=Trichinella murrelli TaxID=144512 RepID=A0A0V0TY43_9BILA|nr:hypothetical protein T05_14256 [Trichinella murrelli]